ncbi:MAG: DUF11 domain-containing protein, partial [Calditrichota bacterium]
MQYIDVDSDPFTFNSSSADLDLPDGITVLWAGLYWGATTSAGSGGSSPPNASIRDSIYFSTPALGGYVGLKATEDDAFGTLFSCFVDVTSFVKAGGDGTYMVGNIQAGTGRNRYGGWGIVVVYNDPSKPPRNLTVFDGYSNISGSNNLTLNVNGFITPLSGPVVTSLGSMAYEGDLPYLGDQYILNSTNLSDAVNASNNVFNSSISSLGSHLLNRNPNITNVLGFDIDLLNADNILANGATSASIELTTGGDQYLPCVISFNTELYSPIIQSTKTYTDINGDDVNPGDTLIYTVSIDNVGDDPAIDVVLSDTIPDFTSYVPGTLEILTGFNSGVKSDASGDDQAEYDAMDDVVVFRLGNG